MIELELRLARPRRLREASLRRNCIGILSLITGLLIVAL